MQISHYFKEVVRELKQSTFPTQDIVINFTIFVIVFVSILAAYLGFLDVVFGRISVSTIEIFRGGFAPEIASGGATTTLDLATSTATVTNLFK